jgi:hypothetical protein
MAKIIQQPSFSADDERAAFITTWQTSTKPEDVANALNLAPEVVKRKAMQFRKAGVPLKKMFRGRAKVDWAAYAKLAQQALADGRTAQRS